MKCALVMLQRHLAADPARRAALVLSVRACASRPSPRPLSRLLARAPTLTHECRASAAVRACACAQVHDDVVLEVDAEALVPTAALVRRCGA